MAVLLLTLVVAKMVRQFNMIMLLCMVNSILQLFLYIVHYMLHSFKGETDAEGSEFLGCNWNGTDTVEGAKFRPPSVCGLPKERGNTPEGGNHTVRWYYDMEYGGCAR